MEYTLRKLQAKDLFVVTNIINKIGFKQFKDAFRSESVTNKVKNLKGKEVTDSDANAVGMEVMLDIAGIILEHLEDAKDDIYNFVSSVSSVERQDIEQLDLVTFANIVVDIIKAPDFVDFIKVASKLFK